ncbi:MAG: hypothetical protein ACQEQV_07395 [Fibrobacterota bacterium]
MGVRQIITGAMLLFFCFVSCRRNTTQVQGESGQDDPAVFFSDRYPRWFLAAAYPRWFFDQPPKTVVAYDVVKPYRMDGYDRYCSYRRMRTKGFYRYHSQERFGRLMFTDQDSITFYYVPDTTVDTASFIVLDSFAGSTHRAYLLGRDSIQIAEDSLPLISSPPFAKGPESAGRIYGYGVVRMNMYSPMRGWMEAESRAIKDLMLKTSALIVTMDKQSTVGNDLQSAGIYDFDLLLENLSVDRRWYDPHTNNIHVALSCSGADIRRWNQVHSAGGLSDTALDTMAVSAEKPLRESVPAAPPDTSYNNLLENLDDPFREPRTSSRGTAVAPEQGKGPRRYPARPSLQRERMEADTEMNRELRRSREAMDSTLLDFQRE